MLQIKKVTANVWEYKVVSLLKPKLIIIKNLLQFTVFLQMEDKLLGNISVEDNVTFTEEVKAHITYKVASYINIYWFPVLIPLGLVGNTLSFLVMIRQNNRKLSTCIYMAAISINDELMMCFALHNWLIGVVKMHEWYLWECKIASFLTNFS